MNIDTQRQTDKEDNPLTKADVKRFLHEVGSPDKLNLSRMNLMGVDLSGFNLSNANLSNANLSNANLSGANLSGVNLSEADLSGADLRGVNLSNANLSNANLFGANLSGADLSGADLRGVNLSEAKLERANLSEANLLTAQLRQAKLRGAFLLAANLFGADLSGADLSGADLLAAKLQEANLLGAKLLAANLSEARLERANLSEARLERANLSEADLLAAKLQEANLLGANLRGANLRGADLSGAILLKDQLRQAKLHGAELRAAIGLEKMSMETAESTPAFRIRINEDPLPAQSLTTIMSALTGLFTKFWLIQQGRFPDLVEYALTRDARFTKEANVVITDITHNSLFDFKFDVSLNPETAAKAAEILYNMKKLEAERKEEAKLKNQAVEEEIEHKRQALQALLADKEVDRQIKVGEANLKFQIDLTALEERKLKLRQEIANFELDFINRVLDTAKKLADVIYPSADADQKAIGARIFLNDLLEVNGIEQFSFILSLPQGTGNKKPGEEV